MFQFHGTHLDSRGSSRLAHQRQPQHVIPVGADPRGEQFAHSRERGFDLAFGKFFSGGDGSFELLEGFPADHGERVDDIPLAFGHLFPRGIEDHGMKQHVDEGGVSPVGGCEPGHASDPEEEDVGAGLHESEGFPRGGEAGEEAGGEPGVEHVGVALQAEGAGGQWRREVA